MEKVYMHVIDDTLYKVQSAQFFFYLILFIVFMRVYNYPR